MQEWVWRFLHWFSRLFPVVVGVALGANVGVGMRGAGMVGITAVSAEGRIQPITILPNKTAVRTAVIIILFSFITWNCSSKKNED